MPPNPIRVSADRALVYDRSSGRYFACDPRLRPSWFCGPCALNSLFRGGTCALPVACAGRPFTEITAASPFPQGLIDALAKTEKEPDIPA